jgi:hypothetical protein
MKFFLECWSSCYALSSSIRHLFLLLPKPALERKKEREREISEKTTKQKCLIIIQLPPNQLFPFFSFFLRVMKWNINQNICIKYTLNW